MFNTALLKIEKTFNNTDKSLFEAYLSFGISLVILLYAFSPIRFGTDFIFQNQTELLVGITILSLTGCTGILVKQVFTSESQKTFTRFDLLFFIYFLYLLLQMLFYPVDTEYVFKIICLLTLYILFRHIPFRLTIILLYFLPALAVIQIIYGYYHLTEPWQGFSDITGTFGNTGIFGGFVAIGLVTALGLLLSSKRYKYPVLQIVFGILLLPLIMQLIYSKSRAAWLAAAVGIIILLFPKISKLAKNRIAILVVFLLITGALFSIKLYHFKKDSADGRLLIWTVSWNMFCEKPVIGFGSNGFQKNYMLWQGEYFKNHPTSPWSDLADETSSPFNELLKTGVEQGIIGIIFILGILYTAFSRRNRRKLNSNEKNISRIIESLSIVVLLFSCFSYPFKYIQFQIILIFCLVGLANLQTTKRYYVSKIVWKSTNALIVAGCSYFMFPLYNHVQITRQWNKAMVISPRNKDPALKEFARLYPSLKHNDLFLTIYSENLRTVEQNTESVELLKRAMKIHASYYTILRLGELYIKTREYEKAQTALEMASNMIPSAFMPQYNLMLLFRERQDYERAEQKAKEILNKKIKIESPKIDKIRKEIQTILNDTLHLENINK